MHKKSQVIDCWRYEGSGDRFCSDFPANGSQLTKLIFMVFIIIIIIIFIIVITIISIISNISSSSIIISSSRCQVKKHLTNDDTERGISSFRNASFLDLKQAPRLNQLIFMAVEMRRQGWSKTEEARQLFGTKRWDILLIMQMGTKIRTNGSCDEEGVK